MSKKEKRKSQIVQIFSTTENLHHKDSSIDYDRLKSIIIAANEEIRKQKVEEDKARFQKDFLTLPIVEIMNAVLVMGIFTTFLIMILMPIYSFSIEFIETVAFASNVIFWITYYLLVFLFTIVIWKNKKLKGKWYERLGVVLAIIVGLVFAFSIIKYGLLGMPMLFAILSGVMLLIFVLGKRALKQEFDRYFLISYFSSMVSLVVLVTSIVAIVISQKVAP